MKHRKSAKKKTTDHDVDPVLKRQRERTARALRKRRRKKSHQ
jgi:hypothetical protein